MVTLEGTIYAPPDQLEATQTALAEHIALTRAESGCLSFEVWPDPDNPLAFQSRKPSSMRRPLQLIKLAQARVIGAS